MRTKYGRGIALLTAAILCSPGSAQPQDVDHPGNTPRRIESASATQATPSRLTPKPAAPLKYHTTESEPNDHQSDATHIALGYYGSGEISPAEDVDWSTVLAEGDNGGGDGNCAGSTVAPQNGRYFIRVSDGGSGDGDTDYRFAVLIDGVLAPVTLQSFSIE